ncbi:MAG: ATP-binding protein [Thermoleophilaceae bacterium]
MFSPRDRIIDKSRRVVRGYAASKEDWNTASSLSTLLRQMQREYEGRFLYELIQNAYDAHPADAEGEIVVLLDLDEGDHGVLYVANSGEPFTEENFKAICELAQSDKTPDESIGNKGVGFKSVLQVCQWPEIYSAEEPREERFGGYCFTFARPEHYGDLPGVDSELAAELLKDVAPYFLPVPLDDQPSHVLEFAARGFASVIRLPIKGESARGVVVERVARLVDEDVPVHLFLDRLRRLEITKLDATSGNATTTLLRDAMPIDDPAGDPNQRYEYVHLGDQGQWFITSRRMTSEAMREAISDSIAEGQLDESWRSWSHDAWVAVATRTDGDEIRPRLYTFLPMEQGATAPLHGHVHAPFSTMLARTSVSEQVVLNARLLDCAAEASTAAVLTFGEDEDVLPKTALADLVAWDARHHDRVTQGFADAGVEMEDLEVVPIEPLPDGRRRGAFKTTYRWPYQELTLLDHERLARDARAELVSSAITGHRLERLESYCRSFFHVGFAPSASLRADWIESVAQELRARQSRPRTWDRFYGELASVFEHDADALHGRSVLLGEDGELHSSPREDENEVQPFVFFPPAYERTDEDDEVEGDIDLRPPATLRRSLILMSQELTWTRQEGRTRSRTPARKFLEDSKLVRRFKTVDLLEHVGRALVASRRADLSRDALRFTFSLFVATRSLRQRDLRAVGLRVPTRDGWRPATDAVFSPGWKTPLAATLLELIERAPPGELATLGDLLLNEPGDWPIAVEDPDAWRAFLSEIGVRDGLWPRRAAHGADSFVGGELRPRLLARRFALTQTATEQWAAAVTATPGWPNHPYTPYRARAAVSVLPGQAEYGALDHRARVLFADLVVAGLEYWHEGALEITWYRFGHPRQLDERRWPSPIATFLREAAWLPISEPGQRRDESFVAPREGWFFAESRGEDPPNFSPLVAGRVRREITAGDNALVRLKQLGMGDWGEVRDAPRLLHHLAGLVENDELPETGLLAFRRAYGDAWARSAELDEQWFLAEVGDLPVVVSCAGELTVRRTSGGPEAPIYLIGEGGSLAARILEASNLAILSVDTENEPRVHPPLKALLQELLLTVDELEIAVVTDAGSFRPDGSGGLLVDGTRWLAALIALILETKGSWFAQLGPRRRREIDDRLRRVRRVETSVLELRVGGVAVNPPARHRRVVPLDDERHPTLIVGSTAAAPEAGLAALIAIARPLCELLGIPQYEDPLLLALERLHAQRLMDPRDQDFARVLEIDPARVAEVRSHIGSSVEAMLRQLVPLVAYHVDGAHAFALLDARDTIETEDDLRRVIAEVAPGLPGLDLALAASREADSPSSFRDALALDYGRFNAALRALAPEYEPVHNNDGHAQAMAHYVQASRSGLLQALRGRYLAAFREGASLDAYVAARKLDIAPDPAWLDAYDVPPDDLLEARAFEWLSEHGVPDGDAAQLPDIDQARTENHAVLTRTAEKAARLVPAWARKHRAPLPDVWAEESPAQRILSSATERGFLDFELLDEAGVLAWLEERGWWPEAMVRTLAASELGLSEADLESEADAQERERQERLRRRRVLRLDEVEFSAEPKDYPAIFDYVNGTLREDLLLSTSRAARLRETPETGPHGSSRGGGGPRRQSDALSDAQKAAVGLIGETIAYAWLQSRYPDVCSPASWVSSYRETIGEPPGDDSLGYDFKISLSQMTLYFEVKATKGTDTRFDLGESQVAKAADCARRRRDDYRIIFIANALNAAARELLILRNPMDPQHQRFYRFPGAGLVCSFELA